MLRRFNPPIAASMLRRAQSARSSFNPAATPFRRAAASILRRPNPPAATAIPPHPQFACNESRVQSLRSASRNALERYSDQPRFAP